MVPLRVFGGEVPSSTSGVGGRGGPVGGVSVGVAAPGWPVGDPAAWMATRMALKPEADTPDIPGPAAVALLGPGSGLCRCSHVG